MLSAPTRAVALALLLALNLTLFHPSQKADDSNPSPLPQSPGDRSAWAGPYALGTFARRVIDGRIVCLEASAEQARGIKGRGPNLPLDLIEHDSDQYSGARTGLRIILRGTSQLQGSPQARESFKRAAARWEALIQTGVTVVVDVDFGPTSFGVGFDDNVVGITDAQVLGGNSLYPAVRAGLISEAYIPETASLYNSLPAKAAPTDIGDSSGMTASSATLRALGLINEVADPAAEADGFGPPPAISFNSKFDFDFNPDDGIDQGKLDFEALALHEMGHVLGFVSFAGHQEMDSSAAVEPSIWDLFRVRPDATGSGLSAAERILSSGGEQSFYAGDESLALSTGRPDGTGGDGRQASHWKDDSLTGRYLGVMDPTIEPGEHQFITDNDVAVLDVIGYRARSVADPTIVIPLIPGQPQAGGMFGPPPNMGVFSHTQYSITVPPGATQVRIDLDGNQDVDLFARFGQAVVLQGHNPKTDYMSTSDSGSETITITPASSPPLRQGIYYMAVANFGPGDADFKVTASVMGGAISHAPAIFNVEARLEGDTVGLDLAAIDRDGDFARADVTVLDETGRAVISSGFAINPGDLTRIESELMISGLSAIPTARRAGVILIDRAGNRSPEATVDFGKAQAGAVTVTGITFTGTKLTLNARGVTDGLELEINGRIIAPPGKIKVSASGKKLIIKGKANQLALQPGANRIRVKNIYGWSNIFLLGI
jgi:hypothetical protein